MHACIESVSLSLCSVSYGEEPYVSEERAWGCWSSECYHTAAPDHMSLDSWMESNSMA